MIAQSPSKLMSRSNSKVVDEQAMAIYLLVLGQGAFLVLWSAEYILTQRAEPIYVMIMLSTCFMMYGVTGGRKYLPAWLRMMAYFAAGFLVPTFMVGMSILNSMTMCR